MVNKEILELKDIFFKEIREVEKSFKKNIAEISSSSDEKNKQNEEKINLSIQKNEQLYDKMLLEKSNLEKIGQLDITYKKINDMLISHEIKINEILNSNKRLNSNYDRIISDNLKVPGFVGPSCIYKNLSEYIQHNIKEVEKIKIEKEIEKKIVEDMKYKIDGLIKTILNLVDSSVLRCNKYADNKQKYLEDILNNKLVEINEKNMDLRAQIFSNLNIINQHVDNFDKQINEIKVLKENIKNETDNIMIEFNGKMEKQENRMKKNLEENINIFKNELRKINFDTKLNSSQSFNSQNKYRRKDYKLATSYNKQIRDKYDLNNFYQIKSSENISEKLKEDKIDKTRSFSKKKTQVISIKNNFKFMGIINKIDEKEDVSEDIHSQKSNIHNNSLEKVKENNLINENTKEENDSKNIDDKMEKEKEKKFDDLNNNKKEVNENEKNELDEKNIQTNHTEESKNKEIIKEEKYEFNLSHKEKSNNSIQNIEEINKEIIVPDVINKEKENKTNILPTKEKVIKSRNNSFLNSNSYHSKNNFNSINNLKKMIQLKNSKTEIDKENISLKSSNSNSNIDIQQENDKDKITENAFTEIKVDRILFNNTSPKFYVKEKRYENVQTQTVKKRNRISFPKLSINFKLINLGSNIDFNKNELRKENSNIDFSSPLTDVYKSYEKKKEQRKHNIINNLNILKKTSLLNEPKNFLLKGELLNKPNFKNNYSNSNINKKNYHNCEKSNVNN